MSLPSGQPLRASGSARWGFDVAAVVAVACPELGWSVSPRYTDPETGSREAWLGGGEDEEDLGVLVTGGFEGAECSGYDEEVTLLQRGDVVAGEDWRSRPGRRRVRRPHGGDAERSLAGQIERWLVRCPLVSVRRRAA